MTTAELLRRDLALIISRPSWFARLVLRRQETERFAIRLPTLPSGAAEWIYEANGKPVEAHVARLICAEERRLMWSRLWQSGAVRK